MGTGIVKNMGVCVQGGHLQVTLKLYLEGCTSDEGRRKQVKRGVFAAERTSEKNRRFLYISLYSFF